MCASAERCLRARGSLVSDELRHAELSQRAYRAAGGRAAPALTQESLQLNRRYAALADDVTEVAVSTFCLGETAAVRLFHRLGVQCSVPTARRCLDRVLRDEVRHREFGWDLLHRLLTFPDAPARRAAIERALPAMVAALSAGYAAPPDPNPRSRRRGCAHVVPGA